MSGWYDDEATEVPYYYGPQKFDCCDPFGVFCPNTARKGFETCSACNRKIAGNLQKHETVEKIQLNSFVQEKERAVKMAKHKLALALYAEDKAARCDAELAGIKEEYQDVRTRMTKKPSVVLPRAERSPLSARRAPGVNPSPVRNQLMLLPATQARSRATVVEAARKSPEVPLRRRAPPTSRYQPGRSAFFAPNSVLLLPPPNATGPSEMVNLDPYGQYEFSLVDDSEYQDFDDGTPIVAVPEDDEADGIDGLIEAFDKSRASSPPSRSL